MVYVIFSFAYFRLIFYKYILFYYHLNIWFCLKLCSQNYSCLLQNTGTCRFLACGRLYRIKDLYTYLWFYNVRVSQCERIKEIYSYFSCSFTCTLRISFISHCLYSGSHYTSQSKLPLTMIFNSWYTNAVSSQLATNVLLTEVSQVSF